MLSTERLTLRPFRPADAAAISALAGHPDVARMLVDIALPFDERAAALWLIQSWGELRLGIERSGTLIGGVCYFCSFGATAGLGYWLGRDYWGQGYASEAAAALLDHGFVRERLQSFHSAHFADNPASGRILLRLGFKPVSRSRIWCLARSAYVDSENYTLCRMDAGHAPAAAHWAGRLGFRPLAWPPVRGPLRRPGSLTPSA